MNISLVTPAAPRSRSGNRVTALRWAGMLRALGHRVRVDQDYSGGRCDLLVALHAGRSAPSIERFAREKPDLPLIVALTGTDLYGDIRSNAVALRSLELATRVVLLQPAGIDELPGHIREKAVVIYQSARPPQDTLPPRRPQSDHRAASPSRGGRADAFEVCVLGHLREVKDPFRAAEAARLLPKSSRIKIVHAGAALSDEMRRRAHVEEAANPRYHWLGELPRAGALRVLARSRLLALTSRMEGGANVVSEAVVAGVPVISSRISGSIGLLGEDYPGYFPVGDTRSLASLLTRAETDDTFYESLEARCAERATLFDPARERKSWADLITQVS